MSADNSTWIIGVSMTQFTSKLPTKKAQRRDYVSMGCEAAQKALTDANLRLSDIDAIVVSYCYGDAMCGHRIAIEAGFTNIPVFNVNSNCSSGSSALYLAARLVQSGQHHTVLALGVEENDRGHLEQRYPEKADPIGLHTAALHRAEAEFESTTTSSKNSTTQQEEARTILRAPPSRNLTWEVVRMFAAACLEYERRFPNAECGRVCTDIALKNRQHGRNNPKAALAEEAIPARNQFRQLLGPVYAEMCSSLGSGAAAAIVASHSAVQSRHLRQQQQPHSTSIPSGLQQPQQQHRAMVRLDAQEMLSDNASTFDTADCRKLIGSHLTRQAMRNLQRRTGVSVSDVDVLEVHDCLSVNELLTYEALGMCEEGCAYRLGGHWKSHNVGGSKAKGGDYQLFYTADKWVVNPSGGLISKGHPIGATGLAQCYEITLQLRGEAGFRQVPGARRALQHNYGLGSSCVLSLYSRHDAMPSATAPFNSLLARL